MEDALSSVLAARRRLWGLTQAQLGKRLGRPQSMVSRWESRARAMTPGDLGDLAEVLEMSIDELLAGDVPRDRRRRASRARPPEDRKLLGSEIAKRRLERFGDPVHIAAAVGISPYRLWRLEGGRDMTLFEFAGLCRALEVAPSAVLDAVDRARTRASERL